MAKKRAAKVNATKPQAPDKPVRLVLTPAEHERLERLASSIGMSMSTYARAALIERMNSHESRGAF